jgi:hypothetical protein
MPVSPGTPDNDLPVQVLTVIDVRLPFKYGFPST